MTIAWVFPGQGSQKLGMAESLLTLEGAKERFQYASDLLERDLLAICQSGEKSKTLISDLNDTRNTQPALFVVESLIIDAMRLQGRRPSLLAGHSLGEFSALYAGEVINAESALKLLKIRSELMAASDGGAMTAVLGFERLELEELVKNTDGVVIANDNSTSQVVLSGRPESVNQVVDSLRCKRAVPLKVSGAFHSPFMKDAARKFSLELDKVSFSNATIPILSNSDPTPSIDSNMLKIKLKDQMINGVRWRETMDLFVENGISTFVEIGPGNVLSGLAKRCMKGVTISGISNSEDLGY
tara:strand:- start:13804 stop:14700 length:897 start_codon:yes stop_codon:yes gene_type:complete